MLGRQFVILGFIALLFIFTGCGGFPDIRTPGPEPVREINMLEEVSGYWVSGANDRSFFKNSARNFKTGLFFHEKNKYDESEYRNLFLIEKSGVIIVLQAKQDPDDDFQIVEDEMAKLSIDTEANPILKLKDKYLDSQLGEAKQINVSIDQDKQRMYIVLDGFVNTFYRIKHRKAVKLLRNPSFDYNPWEAALSF